MIRAGGASAVQKLLDAAQPLVQLLWQRETEGKNFDSPERKAALDKVLRDAIRKITDPSLRAHYGDEIKRLRWDLFNPRRSAPGGQWRPRNAPMGPTTGAKQSALAAMQGDVETRMREGVILAVLAVHPELVPEFESDLDEIHCTNPDHEALRRLLVHHADDADALVSALGSGEHSPALDSLLGQNHIRVVPAVRDRDDTEQARVCVAEELAKLETKRGADQEISEAAQDIEHLADEGLTWRLSQAAEARNRAKLGQTEDKTKYETADTGAKINRREREAFDALLREIGFSKP